MPNPAIPQSLRIGRHRYSVHICKRLGRAKMGEVAYALKSITVATHSSRTGRRFRPREVHDTFWHEVTHGILYEMDHSLHRSEAFVRRFASLLTRAIESARFEVTP